MNAKEIACALYLPSLLASCAQPMHEKGPPPMAEARVFPCEGFTKHADGSWWAGPNTLPFNVGSYTNVVIRNAGPINGHFAVFATGENLYDVLEEHCGTRSSPRQ
jgi:hypothetical protein